jgi:hypothetical protein
LATGAVPIDLGLQPAKSHRPEPVVLPTAGGHYSSAEVKPLLPPAAAELGRSAADPTGGMGGDRVDTDC